MKRLTVLGCTFILFGLLSGCSTDTHDGLVVSTIQLIETAGTEVANIKSRVDEAVKKADGTNRKLDLTDAVEATKQLKKAGDEAQDLRRRIERVRAEVKEEDRKLNAQKHRAGLNAAFADLLKKKQELRESLSDAEKLGDAARTAVRELREQIVAAEGPFEALAR